jgi:hypothetical protein
MKTIVTTCVIERNNNRNYLGKSKTLIDGYLKYTDFDILVLTNKPEFYKEYDNRVKVFNFNEKYNEPVESGNFFNMHIKRLPIKIASQLDYDVIYHHDCDCYIIGWDEESYQEIIKKDYDVYFPGLNSDRPQLGGLRKDFDFFQNKIDKELKGLYYDDLDNAPNPPETRIIFKNNSKLKKFLEFWDKISKNNKNFKTYHCGVYFGTSTIYANMKTYGVEEEKFSKYGRITHGNDILNYYGYRVDL